MVAIPSLPAVPALPAVPNIPPVTIPVIKSQVMSTQSVAMCPYCGVGTMVTMPSTFTELPSIPSGTPPMFKHGCTNCSKTVRMPKIYPAFDMPETPTIPDIPDIPPWPTPPAIPTVPAMPDFPATPEIPSV